jgi:hypothetical protein
MALSFLRIERQPIAQTEQEKHVFPSLFSCSFLGQPLDPPATSRRCCRGELILSSMRQAHPAAADEVSRHRAKLLLSPPCQPSTAITKPRSKSLPPNCLERGKICICRNFTLTQLLCAFTFEFAGP